MRPSSVVIVSPALEAANNGNWQTARRWRELLAGTHAVRITDCWPDAAAGRDDCLLALHARRSAPAVEAWAGMRGGATAAVVLTGTDLYRDIGADAAALRSIELAGRLVALQDQAPAALPAPLRDKVRVVYQSAAALPPLPKDSGVLRAVVVGHLREVKSPQTVFAAARLLHAGEAIAIDHLGAATEPQWAEAALAAQQAAPCYRWLGNRPHEAARAAMQQAHLLLQPSLMEGGANTIAEAVRSGTPVLASKVAGNVGMLGDAYDGYFPHGDAPALVALLRRCQDPGDGLLARLRAQCQRRAVLFTPQAERAALLDLVNDLSPRP